MNGGLSLRIADLQRPPWRVVTWLRRHPIVVDLVVVLLACIPHLLALLYRPGDLGWWAYPLLAITAAALLVRRRRPFTVLLIVAIACALSTLAQPGFGFPMIPFSFALYTVASLQTTSRALIGYGVGIVAAALATIPYSISGTTPPLVSLLDPFSLIALVVGFIVRNRREQRQRLVDLVNARIEHAALTERSRIAAEMHDVVAHSLTVIVTLAGGAASIRSKHPEKADAAMEEIGAVGRDALEEMHRTLDMLRRTDSGLHENLHRSGGNLPTLDELADRFRIAGLPVAVSWEGAPLPEDTSVRLAVFRIVQESLTNTLRHANEPTQASVRIRHESGRIEITVEDDGRTAQQPAVPGHGLVGIEQRAAAHGGQARSGPRTGGGWRTAAVLYLAERRAADG